MMNRDLYDNYLNILKEELVPAMGCTEPIAIAYAGALVRKTLGNIPEHITVRCSGNIIKNVMGVTVPNSGGLKGIDVSATLGILGGDSDKKLEVLSTVTEEDIKKANELLENNFCNCELIENVDNLYIIIEAKYKNDNATVEIKYSHTNVTKITKNDEVIFSKDDSLLESDNKANRDLLTVKGILEFANIVDIEDVDFIITRQIEMNTAISEEGIKNEYGSSIGRTLLKYYGDSIHNKAKAMAAAGSDARMGGCSMPVVTNSGSGNQGITVSIPVIEYAKSMNIGKEKLYRALVISNLTSILQKRYIGKLSAFCGVVSASAGSAAGIAYLHDKDFDTIAKTIINTLCTIGGVVCDGAKESCASKIAEALDCAILGFNMASDNKVFKDGDGLASDNVEDTIANIGRMAKDGMKSTDVEILKIMIGK